MTDFNELVGSLDEQKKMQNDQLEKKAQLDTVAQAGDKVVAAVDKNTQNTAQGLKSIGGKVEVTNHDLAKSSDLQGVTDAINKMNMTAFITNDGLPKLAQGLSDFTDKIKELSSQYQDQGFTQLSKQLGAAVDALNKVSGKLADTKIKVDVPLQKTIDGLKKSINAIDFNPTVNVTAPETKVVTTPVDLSPVVTALKNVEQAVKDSETPETEVDLSLVTSGLVDVQKAIQALRFPVSNYVLPFKNQAGKATQVQLDSAGNIPMNSANSLPTTPVNGQKTVTTSAVALPSAALTQGIVIENLSTNTGADAVSVFIGKATVTTSGSTGGYELQVGASIGYAGSNLNTLYVICASGSPVISWLGS